MQIELILNDRLREILPLVRGLNPAIDGEVLAGRLPEMISQGYQCAGAYVDGALVGICGIWVTTRFYCGKQIEADNVVVHPDYRARGVGRLLMKWVGEYAQSLGCQTVELNCYVQSAGAHKFYFGEGFHILGFHFQKGVG